MFRGGGRGGGRDSGRGGGGRSPAGRGYVPSCDLHERCLFSHWKWTMDTFCCVSEMIVYNYC